MAGAPPRTGGARPPMVQAFIFDLDGTLVDSAPDIVAAGNAVLVAEGLPTVPFEQGRGFIGNGAPVFVQRMERAAAGANDPARTARMLHAFITRYESAHGTTRPYDGVETTLAHLHQSGRPLGLCTNKPSLPARNVLVQLGWDGLFSVLVGGDTLPVVKPDPAPLLETVARLGLSPDQVLFVGDSETDAETARRAGIAFALFTGGYRKTPVQELPHRIAFDHWSDLPRLLALP